MYVIYQEIAVSLLANTSTVILAYILTLINHFYENDISIMHKLSLNVLVANHF